MTACPYEIHEAGLNQAIDSAWPYTVCSCTARVANGVEVILGAFSCGRKRPLNDLHVLDAGMFFPPGGLTVLF